MERTEITVHKPALAPEAIGIYYWSALFRLLLRSTVLWAGFAILLPELGVAWYMVLIVLVMLNHLIWLPQESAITSANNSAALGLSSAAKKKAAKSAKNDNVIFSQRVNQ